jgi:RNA polymerase sigma-70 factor (ECF subfamily)
VVESRVRFELRDLHSETSGGSAPLRSFEARRTELDALYHAHWGELVGYVRRAFGAGPPEPEDAVQQAFAQFAALEDPERIENPRAFLYRCASNFVIASKRRNKTRAKFASSAEAQFFFGGADEITAERVLSGKERAAILERAIAGLKARHRDALVMNRIQGMTYAQVAKHLKISETEARRLVMVAISQCDRALVAAEKIPVADAAKKVKP